MYKGVQNKRLLRFFAIALNDKREGSLNDKREGPPDDIPKKYQFHLRQFSGWPGFLRTNAR